MRRSLIVVLIPAAFVAGMFASHSGLPSYAQADPQTLTPQIIDLTALNDSQIGPVVPNLGTLRSKTMVATPNGTIALQAGNVPKHFHMNSDEIQYIISGTGTFRFGNKLEQVHPGDLIIIPKGTPHAGSTATNGEFRALAIKLPPQAKGDIHLLN